MYKNVPSLSGNNRIPRFDYLSGKPHRLHTGFILLQYLSSRSHCSFITIVWVLSFKIAFVVFGARSSYEIDSSSCISYLSSKIPSSSVVSIAPSFFFPLLSPPPFLLRLRLPLPLLSSSLFFARFPCFFPLSSWSCFLPLWWPRVAFVRLPPLAP